MIVRKTIYAVREANKKKQFTKRKKKNKTHLKLLNSEQL